MLKGFALIFTLISFFSLAQDYSFDKQWENLGPLKKPLENRRMSANGIGPVEFIRLNEKVPGLMLAGSLNGGLFYSKDGGAQWINSGSDDWDYSGTGWADFHPTNPDIWFASACKNNDNGGPGMIGHKGGIYRTKDGGLNWEKVADKSSFLNSEFLVVFGFMFHPKNPDWMFIHTNEGIYQTKDCTAETITWSRFGDVGGWVYDLDFVNDRMYMTVMQHGKWSVQSVSLRNLNQDQQVKFVAEIADPIMHVTLQPYKDEMLILLNYTKKSDELYKYSFAKDTVERVLRNQRVIFGHGRTMALSPHNPEELILGYSTTMQMWNVQEKAKISIRGGYHVDLEGVYFDPFDSLKIYIATHGGVYTSIDKGQSWESTSVGLGIAEAEGLAVSNSNPERIIIGSYHDGSTVRADFGGDGIYEWKCINGGDGLIPLQPENHPEIVYSSNQFTGGGLYVSGDTGRVNVNMHSKKGVKTPGWQMATVLHPTNHDMVFFNYYIGYGEEKGLVELSRTTDPFSKEKPLRITNFRKTHDIDMYSVFAVYNSEFRPNELFAYVIEFAKQEDGSTKNIHRLFKTSNSIADPEVVINSWVELEIPRNDWIGDVRADRKSSNKVIISYVAGIPENELTEDDNGFIYYLKYKGTNTLKREIDICENLPYSFTGRFNMVMDGEGGMFFGTRTGVYYGSKKTLKGKRKWIKVGFGVPHCKIQGIHFDEKTKSLTIASYGRGIWRYYL